MVLQNSELHVSTKNVHCNFKNAPDRPDTNFEHYHSLKKRVPITVEKKKTVEIKNNFLAVMT